jgi:hypothetical protein
LRSPEPPGDPGLLRASSAQGKSKRGRDRGDPDQSQADLLPANGQKDSRSSGPNISERFGRRKREAPPAGKRNEGAETRSLSIVRFAGGWRRRDPYGQVANAFVSWIGANAVP